MKAIKKFFKVLLWIISILAGLFLALVIYVLITDTKEPAAQSAEQPPEIVAYSEEDLHQWVDETWQSASVEVIRNYAKENITSDGLFAALEEYISYLAENNPRYWYTVGGNNFTAREFEDYYELTLRVTYSHGIYDYDALAKAETKEDALRTQLSSLSEGARDYVFLTRNGWTQEDVFAVARELSLNVAEIAAEASNYSYYFVYGDLDDYDYVEIILNYNVEESRLQEATQAMCTALDEMAEQIRSLGITDQQELYRAAARAIMSRTEYDNDTMLATYTDALSDEQKILRSAYGAVIEGKTVCSGYALAFKALCDRLELPCWVMGGYNNGAAHAWNMIDLDGNTYYTDCTFADTTYDESYLFMSKQNLDDWGYQYSVNQLCPWAA